MNLLVTYNNLEIKFWRNNVLIFSGHRTTIKWRYKWQLFTPQGILTSEITLKPFIFKLSLNEEYLISYQNDRSSHNLKLFYKGSKSYYTTMLNEQLYEIIEHKGNKVSFFKNQIQFASLTEQLLTSGHGTKFNVVADDDTEVALLCTLIYAIKCTKETTDGIVNLNLGNIGPEFKKFDTQWRPKVSIRFSALPK